MSTGIQSSVINPTGPFLPIGGGTLTGNLVFSGAGLTGTTTNDSAAAGNVGEYIESTQSSFASWGGTSGNYADITSISLTAGDWDVTAILAAISDTTLSASLMGISTGVSGNSFSDRKDGINCLFQTNGFVTGSEITLTVPGYRLSLSGTTTVRMKASYTYTGTITVQYRLSARRVR